MRFHQFDRLPTDSAARKQIPIARGCVFYFPDALAAVAELSQKGNDKHNPGQPLHWSRGKSSDHLDCMMRHIIDAGPDQTAVDEEDGVLHAVKTAWRALANAQIAIETARQRQLEAVKNVTQHHSMCNDAMGCHPGCKVERAA